MGSAKLSCFSPTALNQLIIDGVKDKQIYAYLHQRTTIAQSNCLNFNQHLLRDVKEM
jgi:hypothetical protein